MGAFSTPSKTVLSGISSGRTGGEADCVRSSLPPWASLSWQVSSELCWELSSTFSGCGRTGLLPSLADLYIRLFRGIPIVVLLLVLNYLVFTGAHFPALWVLECHWIFTGFCRLYIRNIQRRNRGGSRRTDQGSQGMASAACRATGKSYFPRP